MNIIELIAELFFVFGQSGGLKLKGTLIALFCGVGLISTCFFLDSLESNYQTIYANQENKCFTDLMTNQSDSEISLFEYFEFDNCINQNKIVLNTRSSKSKKDIKNELFNLKIGK